MRELARIQFIGNSELFEEGWNNLSGTKIQYGVIALYKDSPEYEKLKQFFDSFPDRNNVSWSENVVTEYTNAELYSCEILALNVLGQAGEGNNALRKVYETIPVCHTCGRLDYHQISNLILDFSLEEQDPFEIGYFKHDLCRTKFGEIIVTNKVRDHLYEQKIPGITFRSVEDVASGSLMSVRFNQLLIESQIGPLIDPSAVERTALCNNCNQYTRVLLDALPSTKESEFYFSRSSYNGDWIMRTMEQFGKVPLQVYRIIINQQFYRLLTIHHITGYKVQPAHLL